MTVPLLFGALLLFVLYVLFGYPLLLGWLAARATGTIDKQFKPRTVSVLLAVRNGGRFIDAKLKSLCELDYPRDHMEVLVLSDGSGDDTVARAKAWQTEAAAAGIALRVFDLPAGGKSGALNAGLAESRSEIIFFTDVRQPLDRAALRELVACFADPSVGTASGELMIGGGQTGEEGQTSLYWRYEKWIRMGQSRIDSVIGATGAIYAQRRSLCRPFPSDTLLDDVFQPLAAFFAGYRVILDPAAKAYDDPTGLDQEFRRKVRTLAGNYQIFCQYPALFSRRNRMLGHFLSHKFARLLLPWALLGLAVSAFGFPAPWVYVLAGGQALFYGLAAIDVILPERFPVRRLTTPARAFVVLMVATLWAGSIAFRPARKFW